MAKILSKDATDQEAKNYFNNKVETSTTGYTQAQANKDFNQWKMEKEEKPDKRKDMEEKRKEAEEKRKEAAKMKARQRQDNLIKYNILD